MDLAKATARWDKNNSRFGVTYIRDFMVDTFPYIVSSPQYFPQHSEE